MRDHDPSNPAVHSPPPRAPTPDVATVLGLSGAPERRAHILRTTLRWAIPALLLLGLALYIRQRRAPTPPQYTTVSAKRGDLAVSVTATGTLAPLDTVAVGTEVSGKVDLVAVDYNDRVTQGQVLARVNTDQLRAEIDQTLAALQAVVLRIAVDFCGFRALLVTTTAIFS